REFRGGGEVANSGRLGTFSSNNRWEWWKEDWRVFESKPGGGKGAATFAVARLRVRRGASVTNEPHNLALQALSETGIVGFLLGGGAAGGVLVAIWAGGPGRGSWCARGVWVGAGGGAGGSGPRPWRSRSRCRCTCCTRSWTSTGS